MTAEYLLAIGFIAAVAVILVISWADERRSRKRAVNRLLIDLESYEAEASRQAAVGIPPRPVPSVMHFMDLSPDERVAIDDNHEKAHAIYKRYASTALRQRR